MRYSEDCTTSRLNRLRTGSTVIGRKVITSPPIDGHEIMRSIAVSRIVEMRSYLDDITKALMRGHIRNDEVQHALSLADDMEDLAKIIYDTIEVYSDYDKHVKAEVKAFHDERKKAADANHN